MTTPPDDIRSSGTRVPDQIPFRFSILILVGLKSFSDQDDNTSSGLQVLRYSGTRLDPLQVMMTTPLCDIKSSGTRVFKNLKHLFFTEYHKDKVPYPKKLCTSSFPSGKKLI
ncbi:hypothetical protein OWV82_013276 [Melia azedarach]|uniref:Uncharacterized protein n=1 Tax=Melia azedarach TaxID=155640 RepID=A0ACC1XUQ1_MELAZ|nr:hypothetical protein OWV82_013276 [Melia azedarach]